VSAAFLRLWLGQWISNLGTQISFYGLGLWLFSSSGRFAPFAAVALVVQLARMATLPVLARRLAHWPRRRLIQLAYAVGGAVTAGLTGLCRWCWPCWRWAPWPRRCWCSASPP
jgi:hypothetical protein